MVTIAVPPVIERAIGLAPVTRTDGRNHLIGLDFISIEGFPRLGSLHHRYYWAKAA